MMRMIFQFVVVAVAVVVDNTAAAAAAVVAELDNHLSTLNFETRKKTKRRAIDDHVLVGSGLDPEERSDIERRIIYRCCPISILTSISNRIGKSVVPFPSLGERKR